MSGVRPNWASAPSTGVADMLHAVLAVCFIAALAAHLRFLPYAFARPALAGTSGLGGTGAVAAYPITLSQTWQGVRVARLNATLLLPGHGTCLAEPALVVCRSLGKCRAESVMHYAQIRARV